MLIIIEKTKAVILAGGLGTRLRPLTCTKPKPLCKVHGESVLERLLRILSRTDICDVVISTMYMPQEIMNFFGDSYRGIKIKYVNEKE
ncbi:MAG: NTP transferase domain-containing protein, partial [Clostridia bacterium]|nr:NTP transferase domain-containing protein [Clostridia bacterium]